MRNLLALLEQARRTNTAFAGMQAMRGSGADIGADVLA